MLAVTAAQVQSVAATGVIVVSSAGALYRGLHKALRQEIAEQVVPVAAALTDHMNAEIAGSKRVSKEIRTNRRRVQKLQETLESRTPVFDELKLELAQTRGALAEQSKKMDETTEVLTQHMEHDTIIERDRLRVRQEDGQRLVAGQDALFRKIDQQHAESMTAQSELAAKVEDHVQADAEAFVRIESKMAE